MEQWAARAGLESVVVGRYVDHAMSGRHQGRPGLWTLEQAVQRREVNTVVITALDRLGRSMQHLTALLAEWGTLGVQLVSLREAKTPDGHIVAVGSGSVRASSLCSIPSGVTPFTVTDRSLF